MEKNKKLDEEDRHFRFPCGCFGSFHAETGALVVAVLFSLLSAVGIVCEVSAREHTNAANVACYALQGAACVALICAKRFRSPALYLPFLVLMALTLMFFVGMSAIYVFASVYAAYYNTHPSADQLLIGAAVFALFAGVHAWLWRIVYLARESAQIERELRRHVDV